MPKAEFVKPEDGESPVKKSQVPKDDTPLKGRKDDTPLKGRKDDTPLKGRKDDTPLKGRKDDTPLMRQYEKIKAQYPGVILLFRVGDFFEAFNDDARLVSEALNIVLTRRSNGSSAETPMAGFPHHALENYLTKLVKKGFKVAVCEQMEDAKFARGIVKREITDIVTPGVAFSDRLLDEKRNNYLCALVYGTGGTGDAIGAAFIDVTTAEFQTVELPERELQSFLQTLQPAEILLSRKHKARADGVRAAQASVAFSELDEWMFSADYAQQTLSAHFKTHSMKGFGIEDLALGKIAASVILNYLEETQRGKLHYIQKISRYEAGDFMTLDPQTKRNLELTFSMQDGSRDGTLLGVIDQTRTAMGGRLFKRWLMFPLRKLETIQLRQGAVAALVGNHDGRIQARDVLEKMCDLERVLARIATARANPKEVVSFAATLAVLPDLENSLRQTVLNLPPVPDEKNPAADTERKFLSQLCDRLAATSEPLGRLKILAGLAIADDAPLNIADGGVIKTGYNPELDDLRLISTTAKDTLLKIQTEERDKSGISSLKVLYNKIFGYYIEISNANKTKVPAHYEKKQTMVNAERYTIPVLKELEHKILTAEEKMLELEQRLFSELRQQIAAEAESIQAAARAVAETDCLAALAETAARYGYSRPTVTEEDGLEIRGGRHPVLERILPAGEKYVPNDCVFDDDTSLLMITGPNMSGKSSYLRQTGLIVLLAQLGSFVPADRATVGVVDKIFTRVGASDNLAAGESTFLVEMNEAAFILNTATQHSLILLDEVGRGTSTYDGMSIAWAMTEYIHDAIGAKTLFATHYHELAELEKQLSGVKNFHATVEETAEKIIFLRKIERGAAESSFGIEVAKMAGLPEKVVRRARQILSELESADSGTADLGTADVKNAGSSGIYNEFKEENGKDFSNREVAGKVEVVPNKPKRLPKKEEVQISLFEMGDTKLRDALEKIDLNKLTPIEAMLKLAELKKLAEG